MKTSADPREVCKELIADGKVIPFVGSGLSARFKFPTWSGLVDLIAQELGWDPDVFRLSGNFMQLAEYYVAKKGAVGELRSKLDKLFHAEDVDIAASKAHEQLVALNLPVIYTTNYENVIERAFEIHGSKYNKKFHVIANIDSFLDLSSDATQIVKFHGTFSDDASLVLTESNYFERLAFESPLDIRLRSDMLGSTLLFLGYSFSDMNLRLMLYKLMKLRKLHKTPELQPAAIMAASSFTPIQKELLNRWDVVVIELDPIDRDKGMDEFLESLR